MQSACVLEYRYNCYNVQCSRLQKVQSQKAKLEQQLTGKVLSSSRKFKKMEKQEEEVGGMLFVEWVGFPH